MGTRKFLTLNCFIGKKYDTPHILILRADDKSELLRLPQHLLAGREFQFGDWEIVPYTEEISFTETIDFPIIIDNGIVKFGLIQGSIFE
ncbi:MAG: hypothetical protein NC201_00885 [Prevotella sp.]|nr:hypothetical protein [Bacteroides sp.]MCM1365781.1 hypothetical protein [Prevotella sp.]MCM1436527.1 hypothetical protein [Prevotella sp.]